MFNSIYRKLFNGYAIGRVERNQNFTANLGYFHNEYEIQYIFGGERYFFYDGACFRMNKGCLAFIDKKNIVRTCIIGGNYHDRLLLEMEEEYFTSLCNQLGMNFSEFFSKHHGVYLAGDNTRVQEFIETIDQYASTDDTQSQETHLKLALLSFMSDAPQWENTRVKDYSDTFVQSSIEKQKRVYEIADYIAEHYAEVHSIADLTSRFFMSSSYLCRIFKEVTNFTVTEYINLHRIAASREYLVDSNLSMQEIAGKLGYESLTYFERVFKKQESVTPLQYRRLYHQ